MKCILMAGVILKTQLKFFSKIENLNLSVETIDGIEKHPWRYTEKPSTQEGMICRFADRIAYLSHDVEDALRANVIKISDIPNKLPRNLVPLESNG